jgi:hypothetical protein
MGSPNVVLLSAGDGFGIRRRCGIPELARLRGFTEPSDTGPW